jgi:hypothetical protein
VKNIIGTICTGAFILSSAIPFSGAYADNCYIIKNNTSSPMSVDLQYTAPLIGEGTPTQIPIPPMGVYPQTGQWCWHTPDGYYGNAIVSGNGVASWHGALVLGNGPLAAPSGTYALNVPVAPPPPLPPSTQPAPPPPPPASTSAYRAIDDGSVMTLTFSGNNMHGVLVSPEYDHQISGVRQGPNWAVTVLRTTRHPTCPVTLTGFLSPGPGNQWTLGVSSPGGGCGLGAGFNQARKWVQIPGCPVPPSGNWTSSDLHMNTIRNGCDFSGNFSNAGYVHDFTAQWQGDWHYMFSVHRFQKRDGCQSYMWGTISATSTGSTTMQSDITESNQGCGLPPKMADVRTWTKQ